MLSTGYQWLSIKLRKYLSSKNNVIFYYKYEALTRMFFHISA